MLPRNHPDRIRIAFDDHRLVANAGLILPATLAHCLGLPQLVRKHLSLGDAPGRANTGGKVMTLVASALAGGDCIYDADLLLTHGETPSGFPANLEMLEPELDTLGLQWRVDNLIAAATHVRDELQGRVPDSWQELMTIPGVDDYIVSVVLSFAFDRPSVLMDTNTRRIAGRALGGTPSIPTGC